MTFKGKTKASGREFVVEFTMLGNRATVGVRFEGTPSSADVQEVKAALDEFVTGIAPGAKPEPPLQFSNPEEARRARDEFLKKGIQ